MDGPSRGRDYFWSEDEERRAQSLLARSASDAEFRVVLGRTKSASQMRLSRKRTGRGAGRPYRPREVPERRDPNRVSGGPVPPRFVLEERERVEAHEPTLNEMYLGDPPPGRSALDRRINP